MENIFIVGNLIWIKVESNDTYGSKQPQYMLCGRNGGLVLDSIRTKAEILERWPEARPLKGINVSDTITFNDK
jgi:hypothetical protein